MVIMMQISFDDAIVICTALVLDHDELNHNTPSMGNAEAKIDMMALHDRIVKHFHAKQKVVKETA